jgi:hypothetical protein
MAARSRFEVFEGNTADPATLSVQIDKLKQKFKLQRVVMVGDRGMLTSARINETLPSIGLNWITALRAPAIQALAAEGGPLQLSLFGNRDMAEIPSPDYPAERLMVCKNPLLADERARKRKELLAATEADLAKLQARVQRPKIRCRATQKSARRWVPCWASARWANTSPPPSPARVSTSGETKRRLPPRRRLMASTWCAPALPPNNPTPPARCVHIKT